MTIDHPSTAAIAFGLSHCLAGVTPLAAPHSGANAPRRMHLEPTRGELFRAVDAFLDDGESGRGRR